MACCSSADPPSSDQWATTIREWRNEPVCSAVHHAFRIMMDMSRLLELPFEACHQPCCRQYLDHLLLRHPSTSLNNCALCLCLPLPLLFWFI